MVLLNNMVTDILCFGVIMLHDEHFHSLNLYEVATEQREIEVTGCTHIGTVVLHYYVLWFIEIHSVVIVIYRPPLYWGL